MPRPAALLTAIALLAGACTPYAHVTGGYTKSTGPRDGLTGGALNAHAGIDLLDLGASPTPAAGLSVRTRATSRLGQGAIGPDAAVRFLLHTHGDGGATPPVTPMELYVRGGVSAIGLGAYDGSFAVSTASPHADVGLVFMIGNEDVPYYSIGASIERDSRPGSSLPSDTFYGLLVGFGWLKVTRRGPGGGAFFGK